MISFFLPFLIVIGLYLLLMIVSIITIRIVFHRRNVTPYEIRTSYSADESIKYPLEKIEFISKNKTLRGKIYGKENRKGIIVLINGFNATAECHLAEIFYFIDNGWTVLTYDGTGVGESNGRNVIGLEQTRIDALAAINYIEKDKRFAGLLILIYKTLKLD